ncbi:glucose-1-phosphate adenylyltransferase subunit GlgD [Paenibacillus sediminis]|uniref:Glucose-1-phosphate adenylyltransferase n=1 Tax=Paenibacillus sediminis TaxID=664909 RepID=A0ABS4H474_9BACL|nr:glucose-1-phosphate adenylyltransferase subunit GlgD [Paenibacillus sediminis]MBP1937335.1 glucose-1-phosphate adenylyltransferase [Paenibacillus sediminis]
MKNVMGIINTVNEPDHLEELTYHRCIASVPFGGRYRLIDFILSSMVNSGITNVAVFAHTKYRSLMDHLGSGKEWDLDRKRSGLFILPPVNEGLEPVKGDLHALYGHRDYLYRSSEEFVLLTRSHMVCNIDFRDLRNYHEMTGADISVLYKETDDPDSISSRIVTNTKGRVTSIREQSGLLQGNKVSMEIFFMKKSLLLDLIETALAEGHDHFVRDAILKNIDHLNIHGYRYQGYLGVVNTLQSYYKHSMNLLNPNVWKELFFQPGLIYTKIKDEPPTRYKSESRTSNSLVANGCIIEGTVENSILFRGVRVHPGAVVKNSIILQNGMIRENVNLEHAILDKDVVINAGRTLMGHELAPFIAVKKKVI